jgi:hypothetical protein
MKNIVFIADYFVEDYNGGAELVNEELIKILLNKGHHVDKIKSQDVTTEFLDENCEKYFILSNFMRLNKLPKEKLKNLNYVLYEHDHKYLVTRNPAEFSDFEAPKDLLVNEDLYQNALGVFCQSKIHRQAVLANLDLDNVINLGSSLWSQEFLDNISNIPISKTKKAAIINDPNPIKQQDLAEKFCRDKGIDYDVVAAPSPLELAKILSEYEFLVFFPALLETFSRISVEAKMVGCKLYTNRLLGAASEGWFTEDKEQIISEMKSAGDKTYNLFMECFQKKAKKNITLDKITVILNAYRRPYNLKDQISAIKSQTVKPEQIWLWVNKHEDNKDFDFNSLGVDRVFHNDYNWKFYGRFAAALLADSKYVAVFDDDTIPGNRWFENCLESMINKEGIMGSAGYIQTGPRALEYEPERCGWPARNKEIKRVDYVGHAWFFKRDWLSYLWSEKPCTWDNGEDIHFSYTAQKYGNIQTYCPPHPADNLDLHGSLYGYELGVDDKATSNNIAVPHEQFFSERDHCIQNAIKGGWKTVYNVSKERIK